MTTTNTSCDDTEAPKPTEPRPLISGLTERLTAAGVDPEAVVDDESLFGEMERLRDESARTEPHHWWRRRAS